MEKMLMVSSSPHVKAEHTTRKIMLDVVIALMPALIAGIYFFGVYVLFLTVVSVGCCVGFEWIWEKVFKRTITIGDLSAVVTGVLLAYNVPARAPVYIIVIGAFVSIILAKQVFGGIGQNFINPALALIDLSAAFVDEEKHVYNNLPVSIYTANATPLTSSLPNKF